MKEGTGEVGPENVDEEGKGAEEVQHEAIVFVSRDLGRGTRNGFQFIRRAVRSSRSAGPEERSEAWRRRKRGGRAVVEWWSEERRGLL